MQTNVASHTRASLPAAMNNSLNRDSRALAVKRILELSGATSALREDISRFPFDSEVELGFVTSMHAVSVLNRYLQSEISAQTVEEWANLIEGRDDIGFRDDAEGKLSQVMHALANPITEGLLTPEQARLWVEQLHG